MVTCSTSRITKSLLVLFGLLGTLTVTWYLILAIGISFLGFFFLSVPSFFSFFLSFVFDARPDPGLVAALVAGALTFLSIRLGPKQEGGQDVKLDVLHREESWLV